MTTENIKNKIDACVEYYNLKHLEHDYKDREILELEFNYGREDWLQSIEEIEIFIKNYFEYEYNPNDKDTWGLHFDLVRITNYNDNKQETIYEAIRDNKNNKILLIVNKLNELK